MPETITGVELPFPVPSPSCPPPLAPQHCTVPSESTAHECATPIVGVRVDHARGPFRRARARPPDDVSSFAIAIALENLKSRSRSARRRRRASRWRARRRGCCPHRAPTWGLHIGFIRRSIRYVRADGDGPPFARPSTPIDRWMDRQFCKKRLEGGSLRNSFCYWEHF